jgi:hypothetical protein
LDDSPAGTIASLATPSSVRIALYPAYSLRHHVARRGVDHVHVPAEQTDGRFGAAWNTTVFTRFGMGPKMNGYIAMQAPGLGPVRQTKDNLPRFASLRSARR